MKVLLAPIECEPACRMRCDCGEDFWIDPCGEENLVFNGKELVAKCPACGEVEKK